MFSGRMLNRAIMTYKSLTFIAKDPLFTDSSAIPEDQLSASKERPLPERRLWRNTKLTPQLELDFRNIDLSAFQISQFKPIP